MMGWDLYTTVNSPPSCAFDISMYGSDYNQAGARCVCVCVCVCVGVGVCTRMCVCVSVVK